MASLAVAQEEEQAYKTVGEFNELNAKNSRAELTKISTALGGSSADGRVKQIHVGMDTYPVGNADERRETYETLLGMMEGPQSPAYDPNQPEGDDAVPMDLELEQGAGKEDEGKEDDLLADDNLAYFPPIQENAAVNSNDPNAQINRMGAQNIQAAPIPEQGDAPIQINLSADINPPPQTSAIMNAFSQAESNDKFAEAFTRMRTGMAIHRRQEGSDDLRPSRGGILEHIARRMENATNFYNTSQEAALLFWGRNKPGVGEIVETRIEQGMGPAELVQTTGFVPAGFTAYWVSRGNQHIGNPNDFWAHSHLSKELVGTYPPASINAMQLGGSDNYFIMLPMSWEGGGGESVGQQARQSRMNLLFFMNPTELQNLMEEGLFHRLEYYSDAFQPTFNQRYAQIKTSMGGDNIPFRRKCLAMFKAVLETFTTTTAFTGDAMVKLGRPDALYIYLSYRFYVKQIMELTNELTILNTKIEALSNQSLKAGLVKTQQHLYNRLMNVIKEMDVWNFVMQTVPTGKQSIDVGYWNFSALGISRFPGTTQVATYTQGTKPWSCYPRWMYQTFQQLEIVSDKPPFNPQQQNLAIDAAVFQFTESMPSALEMIRFKNFQSMSQYALMNREEMTGKTALQKLQMLNQTWANKTQSVSDAMEEQARADDTLNDYIARAAAMTDAEFLQITSQNKATVRARQALQDLQEARAALIPAFNNGQRLFLPQQEQLAALRASVDQIKGQAQNPFGTQVGVLVANPTIQIVAPPHRDNAPPIMYTYKRLNANGQQIGDDQTIAEELLLAVKKNVATANKNLITRAIEALEEDDDDDAQSGQSHGLSAEDAARILGRAEFFFSPINEDGQVDMDVRYYDAQLQEADNKTLIDGTGNATAAARKADGVTLMMKTNLMVQNQEFMNARRLLQEKIQKTAMTEQQGEAYWTDRAWAQEYVYQKYELYKKKWKALQTSWRSVARIDGIAVDPNAPKDQNRPPLSLWSEPRDLAGTEVSPSSILNQPIRVINAGLCLSAFDTVFSRFQGLKTFTSALRENVFGQEQTLAQTWNNGKLLSFGDWARIDAELANNEFRFRGASRGPVHGQGTVYNQEWYDAYVTTLQELKRQAKDDEDARRIDEQVKQRQHDQEALEQAAKEFQEGQEERRKKGRDGDGGDDNDGGGGELEGGGRRKKKTRSKKMRGRKKKTRKTRNKRGGETPTQVEPQTTSTEISSEQTTLFNKLNDMDEAQLKEEYEKLGIPFPEIISTKAIAIQKLNLIEKAAKKLTTTTGTGGDQSIEEEQPDVTGTATTGTATTGTATTGTATTGTATEMEGKADDQPARKEEDWPENDPLKVEVVEEEEQYAGSPCAKEIDFLKSEKAKNLPEAVVIKKQTEFNKADNKCANFPAKIPEIEGLLAKILEEIKQSVETETTETEDVQPVEKQEEDPAGIETGTGTEEEEQQQEEDPSVTPAGIETGTGTEEEEQQQVAEQPKEEANNPFDDMQVGRDGKEKTPEEQAAEEALKAKGICDKAIANTPWGNLKTKAAVENKKKELENKCPPTMVGKIEELVAERLKEMKKEIQKSELEEKCKADQKAFEQKIKDYTKSPPPNMTEVDEEGKAIIARCQSFEQLAKQIEEQSNILRKVIQQATIKKAAEEAAAVAEQKKKDDEAAAAQKKKDDEAAAALALAEQKKKEDEAVAAQPQYQEQTRINVTAVPDKESCDEVKIEPDTLYYTCTDGIYTDPTKSKKDEGCKTSPPRNSGKDGKDYFWNKKTGKVGWKMEETCSPGKKGMKITEVKPVKKKKECNNVGQKAYDIQCKTPEQRKSPKCKKSPCHKPDTNKPKPCNDFKARECEKESTGRCKLETKKAAQKRTGKTPKKLNMNDRKCEKAATSGGYKNKSLKRKKRRKRKGKHKSLKKRK